LATAIAIDANVAVRAVLDEEESAVRAFAAWARAETDLLAPDLWLPEAVSAVRRTLAGGHLPASAAAALIDSLFDLPVRTIPTDRSLARAALEWAERLGQSRAYDALYLAVAERHEAPLVTADERLLARCGQLGLDFVEGLPEVAG
jgi:predicted nucleic acid-binding protein